MAAFIVVTSTGTGGLGGPRGKVISGLAPCRSLLLSKEVVKPMEQVTEGGGSFAPAMTVAASEPRDFWSPHGVTGRCI